MGCTWISVACLPVLIFASITTNINSTSETRTSVRQKNPAVHLSTTTATLTLKRNNSTFNHTKLTPFTDMTIRDKYNCSFASDYLDENSSMETVFSSVLSVENITKRVVTYRDFKEYKQYINVKNIYPYAANILGVITNPLAVFTAASIKPRHASELCMLALGCADFLAVSVKFTGQLLTSHPKTLSTAVCKIINYVSNTLIVYSNMILMAWTIERFIAVLFPIKLASLCSVRNTKLVIWFLLALCLLLTIPYFTEIDVLSFSVAGDTVKVCGFSKFLLSIWSYPESVFYIFIPVITVCVCNIAILCRLATMTKKRIGLASNQETIDKKVRENKRMTILLLTVSGCFLVLHIPMAINLIFDYFYPDTVAVLTENPKFGAKFLLYQRIGYLITEFQNSVNFFLYCISGSKFRTTFLKIMCKCATFKGREQEDTSATHTTKI